MERGEFSKYLGQIYGHGSVMLAMALGHDLGLFKLLCDAQRPLSVKEIADQTGLKERYTKEWLASMVAATIIHQDRETDLYTIPDTHREELKLKATYAPAMFLLSDMRHDLKSCFSKDGPYGYVFSPEFFDWFDVYRAGSVDHILDTEVMPKLTEHGMVPKLQAGIKVIEIGCGTGNMTICLAKRFPNSHFTALDYSNKSVETGKERASTYSVENITFIWGDAHNLPDSMKECFDMVFVYDTLHDLPDPPQALAQIHKIMKDDGNLSLVDVGIHSNPCDNVGNVGAAMFCSLSTFMCLPSSLSGENRVGYGASWGYEGVEEALLVAGFKILGQGQEQSVIMTGLLKFYFCSK